MAFVFLRPQAARRLETSDRSGRDSNLLEIGPPPKSLATNKSLTEIKVISYNIRWRSGNELQKMINHFQRDPEIGGASILGLQEVDRNKKRSGNKNTAAQIAEALGMHYAWAAPPSVKSEKEETTGVSILSIFPLKDVRRLVLPHKGPGGRRRAALGATVKMGPQDIRVYSVHAETRMSEDRKLDQMKAVIDDLAGFDRKIPAIILGDLNTWEPAVEDKTFKLFVKEGFQTPFGSEPTFFARVLFVPIKLKLDWIWLRNLEVVSHGINREIKLSDHWPLFVVLRSPVAADSVMLE